MVVERGERGALAEGDAASETPTRRIEGDAPGPAATTIPHPDVVFKESLLRGGMKIGRFRVLDHLDEGGMGMIFIARDAELDREVALKLLRSRNSAGSSGRARLLREAQALAKLAHPNVVTVYEAGEFDGQVFVAMELVRGQTLREWARAAPRRWPEIIERFLQAGRGLAAAHRAGLVHRDFKPSNVVVGDDDRVRVLDFGLALARDASDCEDPEVTAIDESDASQVSRVGSGLLATGLTGADSIAGTPAYMAPELILGGSAGIRSDVYAFSVALFEALCGRRPHEGKTLSERRAELEAAVTPSFPRSSGAPRWLRKVVLRGLAADPFDRYPTMDALLLDIERANQRRRRRQLLVASIAGVAALTTVEIVHEREASCDAAGAVAEVWSPARRVRLAGIFEGTGISFADDTWTRLEPRLDDYAATWSTARGALCEATRRGDRSAARLDLEEACLDRRLVSLTALLDLLEAPDADLLEGAVMAADTLPSIASCRRSDLSAAAPPRDATLDAELRRLSDRLEAAELSERIDRTAEGLVITEAVLPRARELGERSLLARAGVAHGRLLAAAGRPDEAVRSLREALWIADVARDDERLAAAIAALVYVTAEHLGHYDEALAWRDHADAVVARLGPETEAHSRLLWAFGGAAYRKNDFAAAIRDLRRAVEIDEVLFGARDHRMLPSLIGLGNAHFVAGDAATAAGYYARAQTIAEAELGPDHPETAHVLANLGAARASLGDDEGALELFRRALALDEARLGPDHPELAANLANIGMTLATSDRAAARDYLERSLALEERTLGPAHPNLAHALIALGELALAEEDVEAAHAAYSRALAITEAATGKRGPLYIATLGDLAGIAERRGDLTGALDLLERAYALRLEAPVGGPPELTPQLRFQLARALRQADPASQRAVDLAEAAARELTALDQPRFAADLEAIAAWRAAASAE
ncbi:MAG: tetratricopeptide repeat protein [Nannocystaceae bacterium]